MAELHEPSIKWNFLSLAQQKLNRHEKEGKLLAQNTNIIPKFNGEMCS